MCCCRCYRFFCLFYLLSLLLCYFPRVWLVTKYYEMYEYIKSIPKTKHTLFFLVYISSGERHKSIPCFCFTFFGRLNCYGSHDAGVYNGVLRSEILKYFKYRSFKAFRIHKPTSTATCKFFADNFNGTGNWRQRWPKCMLSPVNCFGVLPGRKMGEQRFNWTSDSLQISYLS